MPCAVRFIGKAMANPAGWRLLSKTGNQQFMFPLGNSLPAGGKLLVVSRPGGASAPSRVTFDTQQHLEQ